MALSPLPANERFKDVTDQAKFTPGPWRFRWRRPYGIWGGFSLGIKASVLRRGKSVWRSVITLSGERAREENNANGALAVNAPNMFFLLNDLGRAIQKVEDTWGSGDLAGAVRELALLKPLVSEVTSAAVDVDRYAWEPPSK